MKWKIWYYCFIQCQINLHKTPPAALPQKTLMSPQAMNRRPKISVKQWFAYISPSSGR
jgi:hypothetical protein